MQARLGQDEVQDKDHDEAKFKISVGMSVMNCANNTDAKNIAIMTVKGIRGCLNKITVTRLDVMCVLREEGQPCAQEEGDVRGGDLSKAVQAQEGERISIYFEDNAGVIVNVKRDEGFRRSRDQ